MLADGRRARSGGNLVKNVTGFDLHRLFTGSRGTLCVLLEASLRLFPAPETFAALAVVSTDLAAQVALADALRRAPLAPFTLGLTGPDAGFWTLELVLAGRAAQVAQELETARAITGPCAECSGEEARGRAEHLADREGAADAWPQARVFARPSRIAELTLAVAELLDGARPASGRMIVQPAVATVAVFMPELASSPTTVQLERLLRLRERVAEYGARLAPGAISNEAHVALAARDAGERRVALTWMQSLRASLDPRGRFSCPSFPGEP